MPATAIDDVSFRIHKLLNGSIIVLALWFMALSLARSVWESSPCA